MVSSAVMSMRKRASADGKKKEALNRS